MYIYIGKGHHEWAQNFQKDGRGDIKTLDNNKKKLYELPYFLKIFEHTHPQSIPNLPNQILLFNFNLI